MGDFHKYHFSGQKPGEQILLIVRRHWINIAYQFFSIFLLVLLLFGCHAFLPELLPALQDEAFRGLFLFGENLFALFIWILFFLIWVDYYLDVWIVTNFRVVNIEQHGLFRRTVSELEFSRIQDITTEVSGVIPTFFNYGDVFIQTAGETIRFQFRQVPDPYMIKDLLMNMQKQKSHEKAEQFRNMIEGHGG
jgi:uncharacterized membrane protein YdbT with pleckstrin-like domain